MDKEQRTEFAKRLEQRRAELEALSANSEDARQAVVLDQQSVGRVSRVDALQRQAMAEAQERQRRNELQRIGAALLRMEDGSYGFCVECGEDIDAKRLEADPAAPLCISCAGASH